MVKKDNNAWNAVTVTIIIFISVTDFSGSMNGKHKLVGINLILFFRIRTNIDIKIDSTNWNTIKSFPIKCLSWKTDEKGEITTKTLEKVINDIVNGDWKEKINEIVNIT